MKQTNNICHMLLKEICDNFQNTKTAEEYFNIVNETDRLILQLQLEIQTIKQNYYPNEESLKQYMCTLYQNII